MSLDAFDHPARAPSPVHAERPRFWRYYRDRGLSVADVARDLGRSREWVRLICLPFDDPRRRIPDQDAMEDIHRYTESEIVPADFYPPHLSERREDADPVSARAATADLPAEPRT